MHMNGIFGNFKAKIVGCSVDTAGFGSTPGHQDRESVNIVVPAIVDRSESTQVEHWRAPEFAGDKNQSIIEHTRSRRIPTFSAIGGRRRSEGGGRKRQEFSVPRFWAPRYLTLGFRLGRP